MAVATGIYVNHGEASRAIKALPAKIRKSKPWIRNVGLLQEIINKDASIN
jgi:septal ring-binding cell division protein DamX